MKPGSRHARSDEVETDHMLTIWKAGDCWRDLTRDLTVARCRSWCGGDERVEVPRVAVDDPLHDQRSTTGERVAGSLGEREQQACKVALHG